MQKAIHLHCRDDLRRFAHPAPKMAGRLVSALQFEKGNQLASNPADARARKLSHGAVYDAPDSLRAPASSVRSKAPGEDDVAGGNRRNVYRREAQTDVREMEK